MHIVYVCREFPPSLRGGGIASYLKEIAHAMVIYGHQVTVICANDDTRKGTDMVMDGIRIIRLSGGNFIIPSIEKTNFIRKFRVFYRFFSYRSKIKKVLKTLGHIDIIECADYGAESICLHHLNFPITIRLHMPSFFDLNTLTMKKFSWRLFPFKYLAYLEKKEIMWCKYITSCSDALKNWTCTNLRIPEENIHSIPNPCNSSFVKMINKGADILDTSLINVVCVGTICETKGCGDLIEACLALKKSYANLHLWFFGKIGDWGYMIKKKYDAEKWIHFYGKIPRENLAGIYKNADVVALPSWFDNFPMTCLEAMMVKGVVLGSAAGGMTQMIQDGVNGFIIPPKNVECLKDALNKILSLNNEQIGNIRNKAEAFVMNNFETEIVTSKMIDYYTYVINDFYSKNEGSIY